MKSSNLSADTFKKSLELGGSIPEPAMRSGDTGQQKHYFDSGQLIKTGMYNIRLQAPKLARKYEIKHWYACGADGRKVGWSVYGHVITNFLGWIDFLSLVRGPESETLPPLGDFCRHVSFQSFT